MDNQPHTTDIVTWALVKLGSVWALVLVTNWEHAAGFVAFCYTCVLMGEYIYKKVKGYRDWKRAAKDCGESDSSDDNPSCGV